MEIYEMTYEGILFKIKAEEEKKVCTMTRIIKFYKFCANWVNLKLKVGKKAAIPDNVDDDDALDMFADNLDGDAKKTEKVPVKDKEDPVLDDVSIFRNSKESHWNYAPREGELGVQVENRGCWTAWTSHQSKDAWLAGEWVNECPQMRLNVTSLQESGFFDAGILVRKVGTEEFRDSKRIDFELYV